MNERELPTLFASVGYGISLLPTMLSTAPSPQATPAAMESTSGSQTGDGATGEQQGRGAGMEAVREHISANKVTFALFCTRMAQVLFAISYILPLLR